jgi:hypothetical protein
LASDWRPRHATLRASRTAPTGRESRGTGVSTCALRGRAGSLRFCAGRGLRRRRWLSPGERPSLALDARRRRPHHPRGGEGQVLPLDVARPARRSLPALVPQRVRRHSVDAPRLRGSPRAHEHHARRQGADRRLRRRPARRHRPLGRALAENTPEGHIGRPRFLELGRGAGAHRDLAGRANQAPARREARRSTAPG